MVTDFFRRKGGSGSTGEIKPSRSLLCCVTFDPLAPTVTETCRSIGVTPGVWGRGLGGDGGRSGACASLVGALKFPAGTRLANVRFGTEEGVEPLPSCNAGVDGDGTTARGGDTGDSGSSSCPRAERSMPASLGVTRLGGLKVVELSPVRLAAALVRFLGTAERRMVHHKRNERL
jgi:hypothetical protein